MQVLGALILVQSLFAAQIQAVPLFSSLFSFGTRGDPLCNGYAALCNRKYSEVTFLATHDSAFIGPLPQQNQEKSIPDQLTAGIRFLQSQTQKFELDGSIHMCHTDCALEDGGTVVQYMKQVKSWLDNNPREVVTILLTNPDKFPMATFDGIYKQVGLDKMSFRPSTSPRPLAMGDWPTLGDLIGSGQRLITFMDYGADEVAVPYILDEFNYFFETPFENTDKNFKQCKIDRANNANKDGKSSMYIANHNLQVKIPLVNILLPDRNNAGRTNAATGDGSIGAQADLCKSLWGRNPNVILVDYFNRGQTIQAQKNLNGL